MIFNEKDFLAREIKDASYFESGISKYGAKFEADHAIVEDKLNLLRQSNYVNKHQLLALVDSLDKSFIEYEDIFLEIILMIKACIAFTNTIMRPHKNKIARQRNIQFTLDHTSALSVNPKTYFAGKNNDEIRNNKEFVSKIQTTEGRVIEKKLRFNR